MKEIWKPVSVQGYEHKYAVSNYGRIKRLAHTFIDKRGRKLKYAENIIKPTLQPKTSNRASNTRYYKATLGISKKVWLHRLVAIAHVPNPYNKPQVDHIDGNGKNNHASNLRWVTQSENIMNATRCVVLYA